MLRPGVPFSLLAIWVVALLAGPVAGQTDILMADGSKEPLVTVYWPNRHDAYANYTGRRAYQSSAQKQPFAPNIDVYVAMGGTRLNKGLANSKGAVILVGLYKQDAKKPFFADIADNALITISLEGVHLTRPAKPCPETGLMHVRYMMEDLQACGIGGEGRNLLNTVDPKDPILKAPAGNSVRPGGLDGKDPSHGTVKTKVAADGSTSVTVTFPYALLRHIQDPYQRTNPGGFFEPNHFHFEIEFLPADPKTEAEKPAADKPAADKPAADKPGEPESRPATDQPKPPPSDPPKPSG